MDSQVKGPQSPLDELEAHIILGRLLCGVIPANEAVSCAHRSHASLFTHDPKAPANKAHAQIVGSLVQRLTRGGAA
jgi:hypothetical protein